LLDNLLKFSKNRHTFHILTISPWPLYVSLGALAIVFGFFLSFSGYQISELVLLSGFTLLSLSIIGWFRDINDEGTYKGCHTKKVQYGIRLGMILFILSEVMLFFSFFWAFFHASISPSILIGCIYPPRGINTSETFDYPFLNTVILFTSGLSATRGHYALITHSLKEARGAFFITINLALFFLTLQGNEYIESDFTITDGVYGCNYFFITDFTDFT
jgi:cytochrome c oxidase subunit 3